MEESEPPAAEPEAHAPEEPEAPVAPEHGVLSVKVKIHRLNLSKSESHETICF